MIKKENLDKTSAWPFVEAKKMLRERKSFIEKKGKITLQTGYGPSGLPHIGTFGEVARTSMLVNALNQLSDLPTEIITFSDDMDGLRKVPDNVPNQKLLNDNLHKPLTQVPDPFEKFNSFGEHNNEMLKNFLDSFKFYYNFQSSTSLYKSGFFNTTLKIILENYEGIMNIIIPTLGKERQQTYSPFLPICPETGHVLEIPVIEIDKEKSNIIFDNKGKKLETSILDGNCKLQWKVDWAMRWYALDIDFEMYPDFSKKFLIMGNKESEIRSFFKDEVIRYFENHQIYHLESNGEALFIFDKIKLARTDETIAFIDYAEELATLLSGKTA